MDDDEIPEWMIPLDEDILELFRADEDVFAPSHVVEADICPDPQAAYRCRQLADHGLLEKHMTGVYEITDLGERVLDGDVDPDELADESGGETTTEDD
ncbi:hypothetical protein [Halopiger goleimassiliensis]|uniref:hypothetical protein n=1 Tax=Halopiger goleimassiliensis TaxID=1293048 RepID=UPI0006782EAC|nr:hypothetical protein [Halopiger goleimassiliensis]